MGEIKKIPLSESKKIRIEIDRLLDNLQLISNIDHFLEDDNNIEFFKNVRGKNIEDINNFRDEVYLVILNSLFRLKDIADLVSITEDSWRDMYHEKEGLEHKYHELVKSMKIHGVSRWKEDES